MGKGDGLVQAMANGAMRAAARIVEREGLVVTDPAALAQALRAEVAENRNKFCGEWLELVGAGMGVGVSAAVIDAQRILVAIGALKRCGLLEG